MVLELCAPATGTGDRDFAGAVRTRVTAAAAGRAERDGPGTTEAGRAVPTQASGPHSAAATTARHAGSGTTGAEWRTAGAAPRASATCDDAEARAAASNDGGANSSLTAYRTDPSSPSAGRARCAGLGRSDRPSNAGPVDVAEARSTEHGSTADWSRRPRPSSGSAA